MNPRCPTCKSPSKVLGMMNVTFASQPGYPTKLMRVYECTNPECEMTVPYPEEGTKWKTEFVVANGEKTLVRPSADEFA